MASSLIQPRRFSSRVNGHLPKDASPASDRLHHPSELRALWGPLLLSPGLGLLVLQAFIFFFLALLSLFRSTSSWSFLGMSTWGNFWVFRCLGVPSFCPHSCLICRVDQSYGGKLFSFRALAASLHWPLAPSVAIKRQSLLIPDPVSRT